MYIRWKTKARQDAIELNRESPDYFKRKPATLYTAYLVESKRINGKPRQRTTYLACIQYWHIEQPWRRLEFWKKVEKNIAPLNPTPDLIAMVKTKLQERVPIPAKQQIEEANRETAKSMAALEARIRG